MRRFAVPLLLLLGVATAWDASAQTTEGSIRGYVRDEQGAVLPGVTVTAKGGSARTVTAVSDQTGYFRLLNVPPDTYSVRAELKGFATSVRENVIVRAGLNLGVDFTLKIGTLEQTIEVVGE